MTDRQRAQSWVIAIDGPSGTGKSTVAREVARRLGIGYLDTGAMYRAITVSILDEGLDPGDAEAVANQAEGLRIDVVTDPEVERVLANGRDVTAVIRSAAVTAAVSAVSAVPGVRRQLLQAQRQLAAGAPMVVEGRDIGTVVFPEARLKVFLTAAPSARATRRAEQLGIVEPDQVASLAHGLATRDQLDSTRVESPLRAATDAVIVDSTELSQADVVETILAAVISQGRLDTRIAGD